MSQLNWRHKFSKKNCKKFEEIITKKIVICASHSLELIDKVCNMGINLENGKISDTSKTKERNNIV